MAILGHGSKLTIVGPVGGAAVNAILDCLSIDTGSNKVDAPDNTSMLTAGTQRTYQAGLEAPGDITVKYNSNPTDTAQAALSASKGLLYDFKITYPGGAWQESFQGLVVGIDESMPDDKWITRTAKIQKSGATTEAVLTPSAPTVTGVSPATGPTGGGTLVVINGTGFTGATAVKFGATDATSFVVISNNQIAAVSPAGASTVDITVTTAAGTSAVNPADQFVY